MAIAMIPPVVRKKKLSSLFGLFIILALLSGIIFHLLTPSSITLANAKVIDKILPLAFDVPGKVSDMNIMKGQTVEANSKLINLDAQKYRVALKEAEAQLSALESLLPAGHPAIHSKNATTFTEGAYRQLLGEETKARQDVTASSENYARASLGKLRKQSNLRQNKITKEEYEKEEKVFLQKEKELAESRLRFELVSQARAAAEKDIARIRQMQKLSGVDSVPAEARIKAYEAQLAAVDLASANMAATSLLAPTKGIIVDIFVNPGQQIEAGEQALLFREINPKTLTVSGELETSIAKHLSFGQLCEVRIPSFDGIIHRGQIIAFAEKERNKTDIQVIVDMNNANSSVTAQEQAPVVVTVLD